MNKFGIAELAQNTLYGAFLAVAIHTGAAHMGEETAKQKAYNNHEIATGGVNGEMCWLDDGTKVPEGVPCIIYMDDKISEEGKKPIPLKDGPKGP